MCADQEGSVARSRLDAVLQVLVEKNDTERWVDISAHFNMNKVVYVE